MAIFFFVIYLHLYFFKILKILENFSIAYNLDFLELYENAIVDLPINEPISSIDTGLKILIRKQIRSIDTRLLPISFKLIFLS